EHGLPLHGEKTLQTELERIYKAEYEKNPKNLVMKSQSLLPLPGKGQEAEEPDRSLIAEKVDQSLRALLPGKRACGECHTDKEGNDLTVASTSIVKPDVPEVWLKHA